MHHTFAHHGLNQEIASQIKDIILARKDVEKILLFGSRVSSDFRKTSDIDIAIFGKDWTDTDINLVKHDLEEKIKTPLKFDIVNFYDIKKTKLKQNILKESWVIYESEKD